MLQAQVLLATYPGADTLGLDYAARMGTMKAFSAVAVVIAGLVIWRVLAYLARW